MSYQASDFTDCCNTPCLLSSLSPAIWFPLRVKLFELWRVCFIRAGEKRRVLPSDSFVSLLIHLHKMTTQQDQFRVILTFDSPEQSVILKKKKSCSWKHQVKVLVFYGQCKQDVNTRLTCHHFLVGTAHTVPCRHLPITPAMFESYSLNLSAVSCSVGFLQSNHWISFGELVFLCGFKWWVWISFIYYFCIENTHIWKDIINKWVAWPWVCASLTGFVGL